MNMFKAVLSAAWLILLTACATGDYMPTSREMDRALSDLTGQDGRFCVRQRDIDGFGVLDDTVLSVSDKFRGHYLMVTQYRCTGLDTVGMAAFKGSFTEFCGRRDSIATREGRCPIQSVYTFENRQAAFDAHDKAVEMIRVSRENDGKG